MEPGDHMTLNDAIEILKIKVHHSQKKEDKQMLQWLLELRTLRAAQREMGEENQRLKKEYEKLVLQCKIV
jgi:hypothetical protein